MESDALAIRRLAEVDHALAMQLDPLFDEGLAWHARQGKSFLENPNTCFLVAFWGLRPCGFVMAYRLPRFDRRQAEVLLYEIGVDENYRRRGIGTSLIKETKRWAAEGGAEEVWVLANRSNLPAMAMDRSTGGEEDEASDITMFTYRNEPHE